MNKEILARNLLILDQLKEISAVFEKENIPIILLKGAALIKAIPDYSFERYMDDIDILVKPADRLKIRRILYPLDYSAVKEDPASFHNTSKIAPLDITDSLWYLSKRENEELWEKCKSYPISMLAYHLPPDEFYIQVLAHAAIHHGTKEYTWMRDLEVIKEKWGNTESFSDLQKKMKNYGFDSVSKIYLSKQQDKRSIESYIYTWFLLHKIPLKGHVLRFMFLPFGKKLTYFMRTLFPPNDFLAYRYGLKNAFQIALFKIIRPALLFFNLFRMPFDYLLKQ